MNNHICCWNLIKSDNIEREIAELRKKLNEYHKVIKEAGVLNLIGEDPNHDEQCEGSMCWCAARKKKAKANKGDKNGRR